MTIKIKRVLPPPIEVDYRVGALESDALEKKFRLSSVELYEEVEGVKQPGVFSIAQANAADGKIFIIEGNPTVSAANQERRTFTDVCSSSDGIHNKSFARILDVPVLERDTTFQEIYDGTLQNLVNIDHKNKGNHSIFIQLLGSGMGKTTILSEARHKCIEMAQKNRNANLERAIQEGIEIGLDFGNGDTQVVGENSVSADQFLSMRFALRTISCESPSSVTPKYDASTFSMRAVLKEISDRLHKKAGNREPKIAFIFLDEVHSAGRFTIDFVTALGNYMCTTSKEGHNPGFDDQLVLVPIFSGTLLGNAEVKFLESTFYNKRILTFSSLSWESVKNILKSPIKLSSKYNGLLDGSDSWLNDSHFRTVAHTYGTFPRGLECFIESIIENEAQKSEFINSTQLRKIEKKTADKILQRYKLTTFMENLPTSKENRLNLLLGIFSGAPEKELQHQQSIIDLKLKGIICKDGNSIAAPYPLLSLALSEEREIPLFLPPLVSKNLGWDDLEELLISFLHTRLKYYRGNDIEIQQLFPGSLSSDDILKKKISIPQNPEREDDNQCLATQLSASSATIFKCKTTNDLVDARIQLNPINFLIQFRGSNKESKSGCHASFELWKRQMSNNAPLSFQVYFTTKKIEKKYQKVLDEELRSKKNTNIIFISQDQLADFVPSFIYRILVDWEYTNEFPYSSFTINQLKAEYFKIFKEETKLLKWSEIYTALEQRRTSKTTEASLTYSKASSKKRNYARNNKAEEKDSEEVSEEDSDENSKASSKKRNYARNNKAEEKDSEEDSDESGARKIPKRDEKAVIKHSQENVAICGKMTLKKTPCTSKLPCRYGHK